RDLRLAEAQDRHRAHGAVEPFAVLALSGPAARVPVVFQEGMRKLERHALWFPPLDRATPPVCDACGGPPGEASICADPAHEALLCPRCRTFCQTCGAGLCSGHARVCSCGATACPAHGAACESCGEACCAAHTLSCGRCCRKFCRRHAFACGICGLAACTDHAKRCGSCDIELCGEHQSPCDVTGRTACPRHAKACGGCGETVLDLAWKDGRCETCRTLASAAPGDPAVAAAETLVPEARGAAWRSARTKTRVLLTGSTLLSRYRVWLARDLSLLSAWGGSKLFGMKKIR
ncbi:MAG: hypothetical protein HUU15_17490, partial [Candidatus Brocadiae bacterium]|nr:hypothetical protein [Candidatus Brocadiia bacterium]